MKCKINFRFIFLVNIYFIVLLQYYVAFQISFPSTFYVTIILSQNMSVFFGFFMTLCFPQIKCLLFWAKNTAQGLLPSWCSRRSYAQQAVRDTEDQTQTVYKAKILLHCTISLVSHIFIVHILFTRFYSLSPVIKNNKILTNEIGILEIKEVPVYRHKQIS